MWIQFYQSFLRTFTEKVQIESHSGNWRPLRTEIPASLPPVNEKQEPWKGPGEFIEDLYCKRFKTVRPDFVRSIQQRAKKEKRKAQAP